MTRLVVIIAILILAWLAIRWFIRTPPKQVAADLKKFGLYAVIGVLILLAVTGRLNWIVAAVAAAIPFLRRGLILLRYMPMIQGLMGRYRASRASAGPSQGQTSTVETRFLRMTLDHDTGDMDGEVLEGSFRDRFLSQLSLDECLLLRGECLHTDSESIALLEAYLDRSRPEWREQFSYEAHQESPVHTSAEMTPDEAREILGVNKDAEREEIIQAHRRLMNKMHPDRGGSDYLATKINLAKDCLLGK